jgi:hypothetical protein
MRLTHPYLPDEMCVKGDGFIANRCGIMAIECDLNLARVMREAFNPNGIWDSTRGVPFRHERADSERTLQH